MFTRLRHDNHRQPITRTIAAVLLAGTLAALGSVQTASAAANSDRLNPNEQLNPGERLVSPSGQFVLTMQSDGNLVEYAPGNRAVWATGTNRANSIVRMQSDGNFVVIAPGNVAVWASGTSGNTNADVELQNDGNVVVYAASHIARWASGTQSGYAQLWGVDSTSSSSSVLPAVSSTMGTPDFIGRYINYSGGLTSSEASYIHGRGVKVLVISSPARSSLTSVAAADADASAAISAAQGAGVPRGVAVFRDIEGNYGVNSYYIQEYYAYFSRSGSGFVPGFYGNSNSGANFAPAYCAAVTATPAVATGTVLYAWQPSYSGRSPRRADAPAWSPTRPACANSTVAWQYELKNNFSGSGWPNVDVDLFDAATSLLW